MLDETFQYKHFFASLKRVLRQTGVYICWMKLSRMKMGDGKLSLYEHFFASLKRVLRQTGVFVSVLCCGVALSYVVV